MSFWYNIPKIVPREHIIDKDDAPVDLLQVTLQTHYLASLFLLLYMYALYMELTVYVILMFYNSLIDSSGSCYKILVICEAF